MAASSRPATIPKGARRSRSRCGPLDRALGGAPQTPLVPRSSLRYVFDPDDLVVVPDGGRGAGFHPLDLCGGGGFSLFLPPNFCPDHRVGQVESFFRFLRSADEAHRLVTDDDQVLAVVEGRDRGKSNRYAPVA